MVVYHEQIAARSRDTYSTASLVFSWSGHPGAHTAVGRAAAADAWATPNLIPDSRPTLVISPCSSHLCATGRADRYAAIADYGFREHGMRIIWRRADLARGASRHRDERPIDRKRGRQIRSARDTLPQLLALLSRARCG